jgi:general stress protein CsbA
MTSAEIFRYYYRRWFVLSLLLFAVVMAFRYFKGYTDQEGAMQLLLILMAFALFMGVLSHLYNVYYKSRRLQKLLNNISGLEQLGLKRNDAVYDGYYRNYYMVAMPVMGMFSGETLGINVLVMPDEHQMEVLAEQETGFELIPEENFIAIRVLIPLPLGRLPKMEKVRAKLDAVVDMLVKHKVETVVFEEE